MYTANVGLHIPECTVHDTDLSYSRGSVCLASDLLDDTYSKMVLMPETLGPGPVKQSVQIRRFRSWID